MKSDAGRSDEAVGLRGAPAVRALISASLMPSDICNMPVSAALRSKYGPGAKEGEVVALRLLYATAIGNEFSGLGYTATGDDM